MRLNIFLPIALAAMALACASPDAVKDPFAGLGVVPKVNPDYKSLRVGLVISENSKKTMEHVQGADPQINTTMQHFVELFQKQFMDVVKIEKIEDAANARVDMVVVFDLYVYLHAIFRAQHVIARAVFLSPDRTQIDFISAEGARVPGWFMPMGALPKFITLAGDDARDRLESGLFASQKLQDFSRAAAAAKPRPAPTTAGYGASVPPTPRGENIVSDVDKPAYSAPEDPNKFAIVIGVEKYASLPAADFADHDAEAVRNHLIALGYPPRHIKVLEDQSATRSKMAAYIEDWLPKNVTSDSTVFFYYSGHGSPDAKTNQGYLVPADGDPEYLDRTGYSLNELYKRLGALPVKHVLVALDSCFSGSGGRSVLAKGARPLVTQIELDPMSGDKVTTLAAAKSDQISGTMSEQGHGVFTYFLLKGLNGAAAKDGQVTLQSLYQYLKPKVEDAASLDNRDQVPQIYPTSGPEFVIREH